MRAIKLQNKTLPKVLLMLFTLAILVVGARTANAIFRQDNPLNCSGGGGLNCDLGYVKYKLDANGIKVRATDYYPGDTISIEPTLHFPTWNPTLPSYAKTDYLSDSPIELPAGVSFNAQTGVVSGTISPQQPPSLFSFFFYVTETDGGEYSPIPGNGRPSARLDTGGGFQIHIVPRPCGLTTHGISAISAPYLDPDYVAKRFADDHFTPKIPVNPFDDIIIDINLSGCPDAYNAWITTTDVSGQSVVIQDPGLFHLSDADPATGVFKWKLQGWSKGITYPDPSFTKLEILVDSIVKNRPINVEVKKFLNINTYSAILSKKSFTMSKCVRLYGGGGKLVVYLRGQAVTSPAQLIVEDLVTSVGNFNSTAPFSAINPDTNTPYKYKFRHIFDLQKYDDSQWKYTNYLANFNKSLIQFVGDMFECHMNMQTISNNPGSGIFMGITSFDAKYGAGGVTNGNDISIDHVFLTDKTVFIHELGHAIGRLKDEYVPKSQVGVVVDPKFWTPEKNCSSNPYSSFRYQGSNYAPGQEIGCFFERISSPGGVIDVFRPIIDSIMGSGSGGVDKFNVVSCGWILKTLKGLYGQNVSAHSLFPECNAIPGIVK